jgi:hypothetical protein
MHFDARKAPHISGCRRYASNVSGGRGSKCNMSGHFLLPNAQIDRMWLKGCGNVRRAEGKREGVPGRPRAESADHSGRRGRWTLSMVRPKPRAILLGSTS